MSHDEHVREPAGERPDRAGTPPERPVRRSPAARLLRAVAGWPPARAVDVPVGGLLAGALDRVDAADAYAVDLPPGLPADPQWWADAVFRDPPSVVAALLALREALVGLVGIERARGDEFDTLARDDDEVLLGADSGHLDFRCVVRREPGRLVLTTAVRLNDGRGRLYWSVVRHVHPRVVRAMLAHAVRRAAVRPVATRAASTAGIDHARGGPTTGT